MISFAVYYTHEPAGYLHVFLKIFYPDESLLIYTRFRVVLLYNLTYSKAKKISKTDKIINNLEIFT